MESWCLSAGHVAGTLRTQSRGWGGPESAELQPEAQSAADDSGVRSGFGGGPGGNEIILDAPFVTVWSRVIHHQLIFYDKSEDVETFEGDTFRI